MEFNKLIQYVEDNKAEHFAKLIAENERKLAEKKELKQKQPVTT